MLKSLSVRKIKTMQREKREFEKIRQDKKGLSQRPHTTYLFIHVLKIYALHTYFRRQLPPLR